MQALVVYESMYGNTHTVAEAIGEGLSSAMDVTVVPVDRADVELLERADLVVVGGPTHAHGLSRKGTRAGAVEAAAKPDSGLELDPTAKGPGLREWLAGIEGKGAPAAAFDTRIDGPVLLTGRASKGIGSRLVRRGFLQVVAPRSFLVTKQNRLKAGQEDLARTWGADLAARVVGPQRRTA